MKRFFILSLLASILFFEANCQIQKGAILTAGTISSNSRDNNFEKIANGTPFVEKSKNDFLTLRPQIGIFISKSLLLGVGMEYEYAYTKNNSLRDGVSTQFSIQKTNLFLANAYLQKFFKLTDNFFFSPTFNVLLGGGTHEIKGSFQNREADLSALRLNITPALTYFISERWTVTATAGQFYYNRLKDKILENEDNPFAIDEETIGNEYGFTLDLNSFGIGFQYFLRNKAG